MKTLVKSLRDRWERVLFGFVGLVCLGITFRLLWNEQVAGASAVFAMAFFAFFYSNLARFKKFKGLGFEAELWEDKQKEAADLIDRLKNVVSVYTREVVMGRVMRGRWGGGGNWAKHWALLDELRGRHVELGQDIDFTELTKDVESVFLFDLSNRPSAAVRNAISDAKNKAREQAKGRFGNPINDLAGHNAFHQKLVAIRDHEDSLFERAQTENIAASILALAREAEATMQREFGVAVQFPSGTIERLERLAATFEHRPIKLTPELMDWADDQTAFE